MRSRGGNVICTHLTEHQKLGGWGGQGRSRRDKYASQTEAWRKMSEDVDRVQERSEGTETINSFMNAAFNCSKLNLNPPRKIQKNEYE